MLDSVKPVRIEIEGVFYSLAHVSDLVRYGSKPARELKVRPELEGELEKKLRSFSVATAYAPPQVFIDKLTRYSFFEIFFNAGA